MKEKYRIITDPDYGFLRIDPIPTQEGVKESIRPAYGLSPKYYKAIVGKKKAKADIQKGTPLSWELLS